MVSEARTHGVDRRAHITSAKDKGIAPARYTDGARTIADAFVQLGQVGESNRYTVLPLHQVTGIAATRLNDWRSEIAERCDRDTSQASLNKSFRVQCSGARTLVVAGDFKNRAHLAPRSNADSGQTTKSTVEQSNIKRRVPIGAIRFGLQSRSVDGPVSQAG